MYSRLWLKYLQIREKISKINQITKFSSSRTENEIVGKLNDIQLNRKVKSTRHLKDIYDYMNSRDSLKNNLSVIPSRLLSKRIKSPESVYLIDSEVAGNY